MFIQIINSSLVSHSIFLLFLSGLCIQVRSPIRHLPYKVISDLLSVAAEEAPVCSAAQVKRRAQPARPMLQVADLGPREALPCCHVPRQYVRMKDDQVEDE